MIPERPFFLAGDWNRSDRPLRVVNPFDGSGVANTWVAGEDELEQATRAALAAAPVLRDLPIYERARILEAAAGEIRGARERFAREMAQEAGKPIRDALVEVDRATMTFEVSAQEARRLSGEVIPLDLAPHGRGRFAISRRFPLGPIAAISPFNFPMNLAAHKVAPAIAAGNPVVLKPATKTPLSALNLASVLERAGLPRGGLSVLPLSRETGDRLVADDRFKLLTFTGSSVVGWGMKARAGKKRVILELGGNAGVIVDRTADLDFAAKRVVTGGFAFSGQSCISVQRVYVEDSIFEAFTTNLVRRVEALTVGDPLDRSTDLGPMIDESEAARVEAWVGEAVALGARVVAGGRRLGPSLYAPTVLTDVPSSAKVCAQEVFAPLVGVYRFSDFNGALTELNRSAYGLQAGVFTNDLDRTLTAFDRAEVGGLIVNDVPTWRIDHMPYGGVKDSGLGREGPRYTIEEMTELKLLVINREIA
jgi:glyceraldehyde-3-phosphate dehydrogenase (NADP+)